MKSQMLRHPCAAFGLVMLVGIASACSSTSKSSTKASASLATSVRADPNGFGGYEMPGHVTEISAGWKVPTISATSPNGDASTWVGVDNQSRAFIQLGTLENKIGFGFGVNTSTEDVYDAFWSDTSLDFHPHSLGRVTAGDQVYAEMVQTARGWVLHFRDPARRLSVVLPTSYGAGAKFTRSEWLQEDPVPHALAPYVDSPYPSMSTVSLGGLTVNQKPPRLTYSNAKALASANGVFLVPTRFAQDMFMMEPADPIEVQYLEDVEPINAGSNEFYDAVQGIVSGLTAQDAAALWISALSTCATQLLSQPWPTTTRGDVSRLATSTTKVAADLRTWESAASSKRAKLLKQAHDDQATSSKLADAIRSEIGLPPPG